jgi:hypothetical protein
MLPATQPDRTLEVQRHQLPLRLCAIANRTRIASLGVLVLLSAAGCRRGEAGNSAPSAHSDRSGGSQATSATPLRAEAAQIAELVELMTPLEKVVTSDISDQRFLRGQELLGKLRAGPREVGLEALSMLRETPQGERSRPVDVERALLDVAAHAAPADALPLLEALLVQYGAALDLRTEAALLIAKTSPGRAIELLEPMVAKAHPGRTLPPAEFIQRSWVIACDHTGRSPVPELADAATNLFMDETARIQAVKELGHRPEPLALQALQTILIESTGNGYLRRMAAQGLRESLPKENACEVFERVASREADLNFAQFLADLLEKHCR